MSDFTLFLGKFLRQGTAIASLAPSSPWLSRTTVRNIDWERAGVIVELGAGTGPITRVLAERARPGCRVVVLERDPDFSRLLRERFRRPARLRRHRGRRPRPGRDPRRPGDRPGRLHRLRPARPVVPQGPPATPLPGRGPGAQARGDLQPDHRAALGLLAVLPEVSSRTSGSSSSPATCPRPAPISAGASNRLLSPDELTLPGSTPPRCRSPVVAHDPRGRGVRRRCGRLVNAGLPSALPAPEGGVRSARPGRDPGACSQRLVRKATTTRFGRDHGFDAIRSVAEFQSAVPLRTYEALWNDYLRDRIPGLREPDLAGPHPVPGPHQRHDPGCDQVHPGLARDGRPRTERPPRRWWPSTWPPGPTRGSSTAGCSSWAERPASSSPRPASARET